MWTLYDRLVPSIFFAYVHSWPGMPKNRGTTKHSKARKLRAIARREK